MSGPTIWPETNESRSMIRRTVTVEDRLRKALGENLLTREALRHHTTFRIGGPTDFYFAARTPDELTTALGTCREIGLPVFLRSEEHTSELQSRLHLVCRLLLEKKKKKH